MTVAIDVFKQYLDDHAGDFGSEDLLLREVAYKRLDGALRNVDLEPGQPLSTVWLSRALGISRTPVREALQQLATDGLIRIVEGRVVTVAAPSPQEIFDALHVRELLEPDSVRLCADGLPDETLNRLTELTRLMEQAAHNGDRTGWSRADQEWHELLCKMCPNKQLGQMVLLARHRMYHRGSDEHVPPQYLIDGTDEHKRILAAIVSHDGEQAARMMRDHLRQLKDNIFKRFIR